MLNAGRETMFVPPNRNQKIDSFNLSFDRGGCLFPLVSTSINFKKPCAELTNDDTSKSAYGVGIDLKSSFHLYRCYRRRELELPKKVKAKWEVTAGGY
jgi:hypothetical protein